jgi:uncharacterized protein (TIGR03067 family)
MWLSKLKAVLAIAVFLLGTGGLVLWGSGSTPTNQKGGVKAEEQLIQGAWRVVAVKNNGRDVTEKDLRAVISDKRITIEGPNGKVLEAAYELQPSKSPKWIDLTDVVKRGTRKVKGSIQGLYDLKGKELKIVLDEDRTGQRPTDFVSEEGQSPNDMLLILKREPK